MPTDGPLLNWQLCDASTCFHAESRAADKLFGVQVWLDNVQPKYKKNENNNDDINNHPQQRKQLPIFASTFSALPLVHVHCGPPTKANKQFLPCL